MRLIQIPSVDGLVYVNPAQITYVEERPGNYAFVMTADGNGIITGAPIAEVAKLLFGEGVVFIQAEPEVMTRDEVAARVQAFAEAN